MSTKNDVLSALLDEEKAISGERLARRLGISRNSVWKAIEQLRSDGYEIEAATNRGYRLYCRVWCALRPMRSLVFHLKVYGKALLRKLGIHGNKD